MRLLLFVLLFPISSLADVIDICEFEGGIQTTPVFGEDSVSFSFLIKEGFLPTKENDSNQNKICTESIGKVIAVQFKASKPNSFFGITKGSHYKLAAWYRSGGKPFMFSALETK